MIPMRRLSRKTLPFREHTIRDAIEFWTLLRTGNGHGLFLACTKNTITQLFRYVITGVSSFLVDYFLLYFLEMLGFHYLSASALSFLAGMTCNFLLTKFFAFRNLGPDRGAALEIAVFVGIAASGLLLTTLLMFWLTSHVELYFMTSKVISSIVVFFWNFFARKFLLYSDHSHTHAW